MKPEHDGGAGQFCTVRFCLARVFDRVDPVTGPAFAADHPVIAERRRRRRTTATAWCGQRGDPGAGDSVWHPV